MQQTGSIKYKSLSECYGGGPINRKEREREGEQWGIGKGQVDRTKGVLIPIRWRPIVKIKLNNGPWHHIMSTRPRCRYVSSLSIKSSALNWWQLSRTYNHLLISGLSWRPGSLIVYPCLLTWSLNNYRQPLSSPLAFDSIGTTASNSKEPTTILSPVDIYYYYSVHNNM